jgi:ankyrin repeat protein
MIRRGVNVNLPDKQGRTPLLVLVDAPFTGARRRLAEMLLEAGAETDIHGKRGMTPLHLAAGRQDLAAVRFLLAHDADPDARMNGGHTPLHLAAMADSVNIARALIDAGADVRAKNEELDTPFLTAHFSQAPEVKALLEKHGGN